MDADYTRLLGCHTPVTLIGLEEGKKSDDLRMNLLHDLVAEQIAHRTGSLALQDIHFLRTYLGLNPKVFRQRLDLEGTVDTSALPAEAEARLRYEACEGIEGLETSTEEFLILISQGQDPAFKIIIDVSDSTCYRVLLTG